jgi:MerR family transcriptional regulator, redox-sensitive transcriptional activator SoxR
MLMVMKIGELARRAGLRPSAIRYYEQAGLLPPAQRRGAHRVYGPDALERVQLVRAAQTLGFTLTEVAVVLASVGRPSVAGEWKRLARRKLAELEHTIAAARAVRQLLQQGLECDCADLGACPLFAKLRLLSSGPRAAPKDHHQGAPAPGGSRRPGGVGGPPRRGRSAG